MEAGTLGLTGTRLWVAEQSIEVTAGSCQSVGCLPGTHPTLDFLGDELSSSLTIVTPGPSFEQPVRGPQNWDPYLLYCLF